MGGSDESSSAITKALQVALREAYIRKKEELIAQRRELSVGRFELEARLSELRKMLPPDATVPEG